MLVAYDNTDETHCRTGADKHSYLHLMRRLGGCLLLLPFSSVTGYHFSTKNLESTELTGISTVPGKDRNRQNRSNVPGRGPPDR